MTNGAVAAPPRPQRGLSTARAVLQALRLLAHAPNGVRAVEVAEAVDRSLSTAYNLLDTLCEEGFAAHDEHGRYHLVGDAEELAASTRRAPWGTGDLSELLEELFRRTHKRAYLAPARSGTLAIRLVRGQQGMRRIPRMEAEIGDNAHALALGKIALSLLDPDALARYLHRGLRAFTPYTITSAEALRADLAGIREHGFAADREEFEADFCCLAVPVLTPQGPIAAGLGISMSAHCFDTERDALLAQLREVGREAESRLAAAPHLPALLEDRGGS